MTERSALYNAIGKLEAIGPTLDYPSHQRCPRHGGTAGAAPASGPESVARPVPPVW